MRRINNKILSNDKYQIINHHVIITSVQLDFRFIDYIMIVFNSSLARNRQLSFHARCDCYEIIMCRVMLARVRKAQRGTLLGVERSQSKLEPVYTGRETRHFYISGGAQYP